MECNFARYTSLKSKILHGIVELIFGNLSNKGFIENTSKTEITSITSSVLTKQ